MKVLRMTAALALTAGFMGVGATAASAAPSGPNPAQLCRESNNAGGYLGSHGGCVSSVATVGLDALMGGAFPSQAAAIANCKGIAKMVGGFPYYFYGQVGDNRFLATNNKTCVDILYLLHTGQLAPVFGEEG